MGRSLVPQMSPTISSWIQGLILTAHSRQSSSNPGVERSVCGVAELGPLHHLQKRRDLSAILSGIALVFGFIVLPAAYYFVYSLQSLELNSLDLWRCIYLNASANTFVMVAAARSSGRLDRQINLVLSSVIMAHGAVAFLTLALRIYYSNQLMFVAALVSVAAAMALLLMRRQFHKRRAALLGGWHPIAAKLRVDFDHLDSPPVDLRIYDMILTTTAEPPTGWADAVTHAMLAGKPIRHVAEYIEEEHGIVSVEHFHLEHLPVGGLTSYQARKRAMDVFLVLIGLPIAALFLALGALAVLVTMGRPIFFIQSRVGLGGRVFRMYKLRSMRSPRQSVEEVATLKGDARVTPIGVWLRRFRVDELPQLWNVLKGDMSIIGPRPEQPVLTEQYREELPAFAYRSLVRPGITGWAQVRAGYAADLQETKVKLSYDLFYLKNFSFSLDLQIMVRTIGTLLTGNGVR
ncbi:sugar transferase [Brevundimonas sp.]|uniref:sugar transferase n=1 Tax=Brevundimonas sp. TaxID=1871086 RepID=UPI003A902280